jgi:two-component system chemotaxis sensor kinase CheA
LDHGIETPEQRIAAGKPETATLTIQASRTGDRFIVEVIDDGRGIDPDMVRRRAAERGLLPADQLAGLRDEQIVDLIFAAGFSTADAVSDISGRGVGMDVVRSTIERIGGRVTLVSRLGHGTTVSLDLPLNIAMLRIMVVEAGGQVFGFPMDSVTKTVQLTPDRISTIKNNDGFVLDDRIVPICSLAELMNLPRTAAPASGVRLAVVAETGGKIAALEVDAIRDRLEVVLKPLQGVLANAHGYAGTTLLGPGPQGDCAMTVRRDEQGTIVLQGYCPVDDTETLFQFLRATPAATVDWTECSRLHTAIVQLLLAARPHFTGPCGDSLATRLFFS